MGTLYCINLMHSSCQRRVIRNCSGLIGGAFSNYPPFQMFTPLSNPCPCLKFQGVRLWRNASSPPDIWFRLKVVTVHRRLALMTVKSQLGVFPRRGSGGLLGIHARGRNDELSSEAVNWISHFARVGCCLASMRAECYRRPSSFSLQATKNFLRRLYVIRVVFHALSLGP